MVYLHPNTVPLIQSLDQGILRTFKAHYTWYPLESFVSAVEENPDRDNIIKAWEDPTTEDAIVVTEKAVTAIQMEIIKSH